MGRYDIRNLVVGMHGIPKIVTPQIVPLSVSLRKIIRDAEKNSIEIAVKSQEASKKLDVTYQEPQYAVLELFQDFAHYRGPLSNVYCYLNFEYRNENVTGYAGVPALFNFENITIKPDEEKIDLMGKDRIYRIIFPFLKKQKKEIEKVFS